MDFELTEEQKMLKRMVHDFAEKGNPPPRSGMGGESRISTPGILSEAD